MGEFGIDGIGKPEEKERPEASLIDDSPIEIIEAEIAPEDIKELDTSSLENFAASWAAQSPDEAMKMFGALQREIYESFGIAEHNPDAIDMDAQSRIEALAEAVRSTEPQEIEQAVESLFNGAIDSPERLNQLAGLMLSQGGGNFEGLSIGGILPLNQEELARKREESILNASAAAQAAAASAARVAAATEEFVNAYNNLSDQFAAGLISKDEFVEGVSDKHKDALSNAQTEEETAEITDNAAAAIEEDEDLPADLRAELIAKLRENQAEANILLKAGITADNIDAIKILETQNKELLDQMQHLQEGNMTDLLVAVQTGGLAEIGLTKEQLIASLQTDLDMAITSAEFAKESAQAILDYTAHLRGDLMAEIDRFVEIDGEIVKNTKTLDDAIAEAEQQKAEALQKQTELEEKLKEAEAAEGAAPTLMEMQLYQDAGQIKAELAALETTIADLDIVIAEKEAEIVSLEQQSKEAKIEIDRLNAEIYEFEQSPEYKDAQHRVEIADTRMELATLSKEYSEVIFEKMPDDLSQVDMDFIKQAIIDAPPELLLLTDKLNNLTGNTGHNPLGSLEEIAASLPEEQQTELLQFASDITKYGEALQQANAWQESELAKAEAAQSMAGDFAVPINAGLTSGVISAIPAQDGSNLGDAMAEVKKALQTLAEFRAGEPLEGEALEQAIYQEAVLQKVGMDREISQSEINDVFTSLGMYGEKLDTAQASITAFLQNEHGVTVNADTPPKVSNEEPVWDRSNFAYLEDAAQAIVDEIMASGENVSVEQLEAMSRQDQLLSAYGEDGILMVKALMEEQAPTYEYSTAPLPAHYIEQDVFDEIYRNINIDSISKEEIMNMLSDAGLSGEQLMASTEQVIADVQAEPQLGMDFVTGLNYPDPVEVSGLQSTPAPAITEEPELEIAEVTPTVEPKTGPALG